MPERPRKASGGTAHGPRLARQARPARSEQTGEGSLLLMEEVVRRENIVAAHERVVQNGGAPGVDGMTVDELLSHCREHWARIREELLSGRYKPQPIRRVEIPKPDGKGTRTLGIPTVLVRLRRHEVHKVVKIAVRK